MGTCVASPDEKAVLIEHASHILHSSNMAMRTPQQVTQVQIGIAHAAALLYLVGHRGDVEMAPCLWTSSLFITSQDITNGAQHSCSAMQAATQQPVVPSRQLPVALCRFL